MMARLASVAVLVALCATSSAAAAGGNKQILRQLQTDEPTMDAPVAAPVVQTPTEPVVGRDDICAEIGARAVDCGADNPERPQSCCGGLVCEAGPGGLCVDPDAVQCAGEGEKAIECGIQQVNRPAECCEGLGCDADKTCRQGVTSPPTTEPFEPLGPDAQNCAVGGERAQECGATNTARPEKCCAGFECNPRATVFNCVASAGTPTPPPVVAPVVTTPEPTDVPDDTPEPTDGDTPAPTPGGTVDAQATPTMEPEPAVPTMEPEPGVPTMEPEPGVPTMEPVVAPVAGTPEPTMEPTAETDAPTPGSTEKAQTSPTASPTASPSENTEPPTQPPSAASSLTVVKKVAMAVCLAIPALLL